MSITSPPTLTAPPTPAPSRTDVANFPSRADAYHAWRITNHPEEEAALAWTYATAVDMYAKYNFVLDHYSFSTSSAASAAAAVVSANAAHASELNAVAVVTGGTASLTAAATKIPISDSNSLLDSTWLENNASYQKLNEGINYATDLAGHAVDDLSRSKALTATAGKIPVSGNDAMIDSTWLENNASYQKLTAGLAYAVDIAGKASSPIALPADTKTGTSTGNPGNIAYDSSYLYICTAKNVWKLISLTAF